ncbi:MAG: hypothetical protein WCA46_13700 [Actinocatenispora sp.]
MAQPLTSTRLSAPVDVSVAMPPQQVLFLLMRDAASDDHQPALMPQVVHALRGALSGGPHAFVVRPARRGRPPGLIPSALVPISPNTDVDVPAQVARLRDYPTDELVADIAGLGPAARVWWPAVDNPKRWLLAYAGAALRRLDVPATMGALAAHLGVTAGAATATLRRSDVVRPDRPGTPRPDRARVPLGGLVRTARPARLIAPSRGRWGPSEPPKRRRR